MVEKPFGTYRESGEVGWLQHMDSTNPSWFAYSFTVPEGQQPYYFEIDYPDDQQRTFCLAVREATPGPIPPRPAPTCKSSSRNRHCGSPSRGWNSMRWW